VRSDPDRASTGWVLRRKWLLKQKLAEISHHGKLIEEFQILIVDQDRLHD
jgi:hypothetical protein